MQLWVHAVCCYSKFQHICKERHQSLKPQCSTIKGFAFTSTCSSETVSLLSYYFVALEPVWWTAKVLKFAIRDG